MADLIRIVYASQPFGYDEAILNGILIDARRNNARDGITGALVCRRDVYLQLLEGPETSVRAAYTRILRDDRHLDVRELVAVPVEGRIFGAWAMLHDPARTVIWSEEEIAAGAFDRASAAEIGQVFEDLATKAGTDAPA